MDGTPDFWKRLLQEARLRALSAPFVSVKYDEFLTEMIHWPNNSNPEIRMTNQTSMSELPKAKSFGILY